jgi:oligopeptide/dipeptide ABC transporter ATP-binding protein
VTVSETSWTPVFGGDRSPKVLLRVRNLKTNFYTYAGVVKALDGVSFDVIEGSTLGLVGETGCGKSVTALSILRLIPQPPGKIEEGEVLFDLPDTAWEEVERLEAEVTSLLLQIFRETPEARPPDLSVRRLELLRQAAARRDGASPSDVEAFQAATSALIRLKTQHDLLLKPDRELRTIRGNRIAMIFQDPMQALNPVLPVGDQIAENILLHQETALTKAVSEKMELEKERDSLGRDFHAADPGIDAPETETASRDSRLLTVVAIAWMVVSVLSIVAFASSLARIVSVATGDVTVPFGAGLVVSSLAILVSFQAFRLRPSARHLSLAFATLELCSRFILLLLPVSAAIRLFFLLGLIMDFAVLGVATRSDIDRVLRGRYGGWEKALHLAEGDTSRLLDLRDLVARSPLLDRRREALTVRLDRIIAEANRILKTDELITGHFHPLLPRNLQLAYYRRRLARSGSGIYRRLKDKAILGLIAKVASPFEKPLYNEGIAWAVDMLRGVRISDPVRIANQYPYELSGGMQQRALIAIALSCNPKLLIADEPTTALDVTIQAQILELIKEMKRAFGSTVLLITHDLGIIAEMCDRVCVMYAGHIAEDSSARAVFKNPLHPYTQGLMKAIPSHILRKETLEIIRGSVPNLVSPPPGCRFHPRCPFVMPTCGWSPVEVGNHLRDAFMSLAKDRVPGIDMERISWDPHGPAELRITFPGNEANPATAVEWIQAAVDASRAKDVVLQAITAVAPARPLSHGDVPYHVEVRISVPRKPPDYVPEPGHYVACFLYEREYHASLLEGHRVG